MLAVINATPTVHYGYRVGVPVGGSWRELLNSDAEIFGGSGKGNLGQVESEDQPWHGFDHSLPLTLPPLSVVFLQPDASDGALAGTAASRRRSRADRRRAAASRTTVVSVVLTWAIGRSFDDVVEPRRDGGRLVGPVISTTRARAPLTTGGVSVIRTWPWYSADRATGSVRLITGSPGGHEAVWPSGPIPRWTTSKLVRQLGGVARRGLLEVRLGDRHEEHAGREADERVGVARRVAVGGHPFVDLEDRDVIPRQVGAGELGQHRRTGVATGHGERGAGRAASTARRRWSARRSAARSDGWSSTSTDGSPGGSATTRSWHDSPFAARWGTRVDHDDDRSDCDDSADGPPLARAAGKSGHHGPRRALPVAGHPGDPVRPGRDVERPGQPGRRVRDAGRAAVREVPAGGADRRAHRAVPVAADPGVRRRPCRG